MEKPERHELIRELLRRNEISSQDQLQDLLAVEGCEIVQSTLSRDLREIGVIKERGVYELPDTHPDHPNAASRLARDIREELARVDAGGTVVVLRLAAGADPEAIARRVEAAALPSVVAAAPCIGTVLVVTRTPGYAGDLVRMLRSRSAFPRGR